MGMIYEELTLRNAGDVFNARREIIKEAEIRQTKVTAIVDTGAATMVINEDICRQLGLELEPDKHYKAMLADGTRHTYSWSEPVEVQWKDRSMVCQAIVVPTAKEILLGVIPLEAMDLIVHPLKQELTGAHGDTVIIRI